MLIGLPLYKKANMSQTPACPKCQCEYTYASDALMVCPECFHEWNPGEAVADETANTEIKDANGVALATGDSVLIVKDLPIKGAQKAIKAGTKVKNIRLMEAENIHTGHNIDCKIEGFGAIVLKSEFVRKV